MGKCHCPPGPVGPQGPAGPQGPQGPAGPNNIYLATFTSMPSGNFMGLGVDNVDFDRVTVVVPQDGTISRLVFSIRDNVLGDGDTATATIFVSSTCAFGTLTSTMISATITGPNDSDTPNCCAVATGSFSVKQCDLISVQVTTTGPGGSSPALTRGAAATITLA